MLENITSVTDNRVITQCVPNCSLELLGGFLCSPFMATVCKILVVVAVTFFVMLATGEIDVDRLFGGRTVQEQADTFCERVALTNRLVRIRLRVIVKEVRQENNTKLDLTHEFHPINPIGGMTQVPGKVITVLGASEALPPVVDNDWATIYANVQPRRESKIV